MCQPRAGREEIHLFSKCFTVPWTSCLAVGTCHYIQGCSRHQPFTTVAKGWPAGGQKLSIEISSYSPWDFKRCLGGVDDDK